MTDKKSLKIDPEVLAHDHADPVDDLEGVEQIVDLFDEELTEAERIALGIDRLVPTDEVIVPDEEGEV